MDFSAHHALFFSFSISFTHTHTHIRIHLRAKTKPAKMADHDEDELGLLRDDLAVQTVILTSLETETSEEAAVERREAREEIARLKTQIRTAKGKGRDDGAGPSSSSNRGEFYPRFLLGLSRGWCDGNDWTTVDDGRREEVSQTGQRDVDQSACTAAARGLAGSLQRWESYENGLHAAGRVPGRSIARFLLL